MVHFTHEGWQRILDAERGYELTKAAEAGEVVVIDLGGGSTFVQVPSMDGSAAVHWASSDQPDAIHTFYTREGGVERELKPGATECVTANLTYKSPK